MWYSSLSSTSNRFPGSTFFRIHVFQGPGFFVFSFLGVQIFQRPVFLGSRFFRVQIFQGPCFSGTRFFWVYVFQSPSPASGSRILIQVLEVAIKRCLFSMLNEAAKDFHPFLKTSKAKGCFKLLFQFPIKQCRLFCSKVKSFRQTKLAHPQSMFAYQRLFQSMSVIALKNSAQVRVATKPSFQ